MRLSVEQIASGFRVDQCTLQRAIDEKVVQLDAAGTLSLMAAQALSRFVSDEFEEMFGSAATFLGSQLVYSEAIRFNNDKIAPAGWSLLGPNNLDIVTGGRELFQVESLEQLYDAGVNEISDEISDYGFVIRKKNLTEIQALADAYMLGDARVQQAVRDRLLAGTRAVALELKSVR
ncbi:hypothetical protein [Corynebacterium pseudogenitalium]|uniref:hypothetical protein n=1 Tax=Corynebacterium pseudogenitalium TaxID=38303 RepID=UPI0021098EB1|nr:hypothetical protein [Corynebacterium pseudogenitalium]